jgi:hypothetical protein
MLQSSSATRSDTYTYPTKIQALANKYHYVGFISGSAGTCKPYVDTAQTQRWQARAAGVSTATFLDPIPATDEQGGVGDTTRTAIMWADWEITAPTQTPPFPSLLTAQSTAVVSQDLTVGITGATSYTVLGLPSGLAATGGDVSDINGTTAAEDATYLYRVIATNSAGSSSFYGIWQVGAGSRTVKGVVGGVQNLNGIRR